MLIKPDSITFPAHDGSRRIDLPMEQVARAEARMEEVQFVTGAKAPELLTALNRGWLYVSKLALVVNQHKLKAETATATRRAIVLLDVMPALLKERGIRSSTEVRDAILIQDIEYATCMERENEIRAVLELLKLKAKGLENAFSSVKKIIGDRSMLTGVGNLSVNPGEIGNPRESDE